MPERRRRGRSPRSRAGRRCPGRPSRRRRGTPGTARTTPPTAPTRRSPCGSRSTSRATADAERDRGRPSRRRRRWRSTSGTTTKTADGQHEPHRARVEPAVGHRLAGAPWRASRSRSTRSLNQPRHAWPTSTVPRTSRQLAGRPAGQRGGDAHGQRGDERLARVGGADQQQRGQVAQRERALGFVSGPVVGLLAGPPGSRRLCRDRVGVGSATGSTASSRRRRRRIATMPGSIDHGARRTDPDPAGHLRFRRASMPRPGIAAKSGLAPHPHRRSVKCGLWL